jgi:23S rRNA (adenine2503-C2)-methyltransferase
MSARPSAPRLPQPDPPKHDHVDLRSFDRAGLARFLEESVGSASAAERLFQELWQDDARSVSALSSVRKSLRARLARVTRVSRLTLDREIVSADGAKKLLWRLDDGHVVESVLIPDGDRLTLCMSTQVGCAMACTFCLTGDMGLVRHLTAAEIALQPYEVGRTLPAGQRITNLVLMGMGEPLHNLDQLVPALRVCLDDFGLKLSHRRITVSTVGLVPKLAELAAALPVNLAVSLNATTEEQRRAIMPVTKRWSLEQLLDACRAFPLPSGKRITFEMVLFAGFNDTLEDAERLRHLLRGIPAKVNLIPYNENPGRPTLRRPSDAVVRAYQHHLVSRGTSCSVRTTRGLDVSAACGQLGRGAA